MTALTAPIDMINSDNIKIKIKTNSREKTNYMCSYSSHFRIFALGRCVYINALLLVICAGLNYAAEEAMKIRIHDLQEAIYAKAGKSVSEQLSKMIKDGVIDKDLADLFALKKEFIEKSSSRNDILSKQVVKNKFFNLTVEEAVGIPAHAQNELFWWWSMSGNGERAMLLANVMASSGDATQKSLAAIGMSLAYGSVARWDDSVSWATQAATFASFSSGQSTGGQAPQWLQSAVRRRIDEAILLRDLALYGIGYRMYVEANEASARGDSSNAYKIYDDLRGLTRANLNKASILITSIYDGNIREQPIHTVFGNAARVYAARSLAQMGKHSEAIKYLKNNQPINDDPYKIDEVFLLAEIAFDLSETKKSLDLLTSALDLARKKHQIDATSVLPDGLAKITAPPQNMRTTSPWGTAEWFKQNPSELYNIALCNWYASYMQIKIYNLQAIAYFSEGNTGEALKALSLMKSLDVEDAKLGDSGMPSNYTRLRDGVLSGRFYAEAQELAYFKGRERPLLLRAELAMEMEQWATAEQGYTSVKERFGDSLTTPALAYLDYAIASASIYRGDTSRALRLLSGFNGEKPEYRKTSTYWRSIYARANLEKPEVALSIYESALNDNPPATVARQLRFTIGQVAVGVESNEKARKYFNAVINEGVEDYRTDAARKYLIILDAGGLEGYQQQGSQMNNQSAKD